MSEISKLKLLKNVFKDYKSIWIESCLLYITGILIIFLGYFVDLDYTILLGIMIIVGSFVGVFFGLLLGHNIGWVVSLSLNLFLGVYIAYYLMGAHEIVFASYISPIIGGLTGWYASKRKIYIDKGIEVEYFNDSILDFNK